MESIQKRVLLLSIFFFLGTPSLWAVDPPGPSPFYQWMARGLSKKLQDEIRQVDPVDKEKPQTDQAEDDDEYEEYILYLPPPNDSGGKKNKVKVRAKRGTMNLLRKKQELNQMLIDDVVRMGGLKAP